MPIQQSETLQRFAFEGPLSAGQAIVLGIVVAALFGWALWQEGKLAKSRLTPLFWGLRLIAVALLFWMLMGPTNQLVHRETTPKSIAILADGSRSMEVVDPPQDSGELRWALAQQPGADGQLAASCDRLAIAVLLARDHLQSALDGLERGGRIETLRASAETARRAAESAAGHATAIRTLLDGQSDTLRKQAGSIAQTIGESLLPKLTAFAERVERGQAVLRQSEAAAMRALEAQLSKLAESANRLSESVLRQHPRFVDVESGQRLRRDMTLSRGEKVARVLNTADESWLAEVARTVRVRRMQFDTLASPVSPGDWSPALNGSSQDRSREADDGLPATDLSAALEAISREAANEMFEQVILITDGRHNATASRNPGDVAAGLGRLPVHVVPIGNSELLRDVILHHVEAPAAVAESDSIVVDAIVSAYDAAGETCVVELLKEDEVLDRQQIEIKDERSDHRLRFNTRAPATGRHAYELRVAALPGETVDDNNAATFSVDVVDDTIRILLADHLPRWEFRYLANLFYRDDRIEFDQLLFGPERAGTGKLRSRPAFPRDVDGWSRYRVAIIGDVSPTQLDAESQRALKEYLAARGGTVILIAGRGNMPQAFGGDPLGSLLPVEPADTIDGGSAGLRLELTPEGRLNSAMHIAEEEYASDRIWREMSDALPLYSLSEYCRPKPTAHTLIRATTAAGRSAAPANEAAFLCWQNVGRGRVVYLAAPATYQLRMRHGDRYHHRFWGQLIRWSIARELAAGSKTVRINSDKSHYESEESVSLFAQLMEMDGAPVSGAALLAEAVPNAPAALSGDVVAATAQFAEDENIPGRYIARLDNLSPGSYRVRVSGSEVDRLLSTENASGPIEIEVTVEPPTSTEMADTRANHPLLEQIAEVTGGLVVPPTAISEVVRLADLSPHVREETTRRPLWTRWLFLWVVIVCLGAEWGIRKLIGLA